MPIRRILAPALVVLLLAGACASGGSTSETAGTVDPAAIAGEGSLTAETEAPAQPSTTEAMATETTLPAPEAVATTEATETTAAAEEPGINRTGEFAHVVLVEPNDVLNIRYGPGVGFDIAGTFGPTARDLPLTDVTDVVNGSPWVFIDGNGWVSQFFLTEAVAAAEAESNPATLETVQELSDIMAARGDLGEVVGWRGLFVAHFSPVVRFKADQLAGLLSSPTLYEWGSQGCSPSECPERTFSEAVAESFVGAWEDTDKIVTFDEKIPGPGGLGDAGIIPQEFANYHYVAVHDPGDDPQYEGLDWVTWYVYLDYSEARPVVVGMSVDSWGP